MGKNDQRSRPVDIISRLQDHGLFRDLSPSLREALGVELEEVTLSTGEWLFRQGDPGDSMYILDRGGLRVVITTRSGEETEVDKLSPGAPVGEMALLTGQARTADVQAMTDSSLIRFSKAAFDNLIRQHAEIRERIIRLTAPRFQRTQMAGVLTRIFGQLDATEIHEIQEQLEWRRVAGGEMVFQQGDPGDYMVIIVNGRLRVMTDDPDLGRRSLGEVGRGQTVGEFSMLTGEPRNASVCAVRDSDLLILSTETFEKLIQRFPKAVLQISRNLALRLHRAGRRPEKELDRGLSLAIVPIGECAPLTEFAQGLIAEIERFGPSLLLSAEAFDEGFGKEGASQTDQDDPISIAIVGWMNEQEVKNRYIIYQADNEWSEWTRRCLRQSDRIVFVAEAGPPLSLTRLEQAIAEEKLEAQKELVLLYPDRSGKPSNTAGWLAPRELDAHHHLRLGHDPDCQRLARRLTDRAVGLVLSGGGARGAVHGGVYKAMKELGIDGDIIGGVSMGALLGAMFAMEYDLDTMLELGRQHLTTKALMDYTFPAVALCKTKKVSQLMHKLFGEVAIEDLFIPYFCVSANLSKSQPVIHKTGPLSLALRASMAFPGIFAPVSYDGDILVDGAVMNNLPIDVMREQRGVGPIIAVTASPKDEKDHKWDLPLSISGWGVLRRRINPFAKPVSVPSIAATIMRTLDVNSTYLLQQTRGLADVIISPDTREYHNLDWAAYPHLVELGYQAAKKELAEWKRGSSGV